MNAVELFVGAGGASLGILSAGFTEVRAVEWNHEACETRRAAGLRCDEGDVRDPVHYEGVSADLLWSSFPCQAWSTAGKRLGKDDPRNGWPWTVDVLDQVRPRWFLGENVAGLTHHRGGCERGRCTDDCARLYLEQTILRQLGERFAWVGWSILDAARFGVPQNRERLFLVAGPRPIEWPRETHAPPEELRTVGLFGETRKPWRTVREALGLGLSTIGQTTPATAKGGNLWRSPDAPAPTIPSLSGSGGWNGVHAREDLPGRGAIPQSRRPMRLDTPADTIQASGEGPRPPCIPMDEPSPTIRAQASRDHTGHRGGHAAPLIEDPKHPHARPESLAPTIRSGGSGHSSPPMWLRLAEAATGPGDRVVGSGRRGRGMAEWEPRDVTDEPAGTISAMQSSTAGHYMVTSAPESGVWTCDDCGTETRFEDWRIFSGTACPGCNSFTGGWVTYDPPLGGGPASKVTRAASRPELLDRPSPTVTAVGECKGSGDGGNPEKMQQASDALFLGAGIRRLTPAECAILQDFPADHPWRGTKTSIYAQIGNAVPPTLARVMCEAVAKADASR